MYMLALASGTPSALLDWNNNYGSRPRQVRLLPLLQPAQALLQRRPHGLPGDHRRHRRQGEHLRHLRRPRQGRRHVLRALLHRRSPRHHSRLHRRGQASPTIRSRPSAAPALPRFRNCRSCSSTSAAKASSTTSPPTSATSQSPSTKPPATSAGRATTIPRSKTKCAVAPDSRPAVVRVSRPAHSANRVVQGCTRSAAPSKLRLRGMGIHSRRDSDFVPDPRSTRSQRLMECFRYLLHSVSSPVPDRWACRCTAAGESCRARLSSHKGRQSTGC